MDPEKKKELDRELRKRRLKIGIEVAGALIPAIVFLLWYFPFETVGTREGTAVSVTSQQSDEGTFLLMVVALDDGQEITARMGKRMSYKPGANVVLREKRNLFGFTSYSFIRHKDG